MDTTRREAAEPPGLQRAAADAVSTREPLTASATIAPLTTDEWIAFLTREIAKLQFMERAKASAERMLVLERDLGKVQRERDAVRDEHARLLKDIEARKQRDTLAAAKERSDLVALLAQDQATARRAVESARGELLVVQRETVTARGELTVAEERLTAFRAASTLEEAQATARVTAIQAEEREIRSRLEAAGKQFAMKS